MRALVVGGGAIGQFLAAKLGQAGHEAVVLARAEAADAIKTHGITLRQDGGRAIVRVQTAADLQDENLRDPFETVIIAVKSYSTQEAIAAIQQASGCVQSSILTVQNGLGNEEQLQDAFGADRVVAGALTIAVDRIDTTTIEATSKGGLCIAPVGSTPHNWMLLLWESAGMRVRPINDWRSMKWSKLCINILGNAVCAALDWTPAEVYRNATSFVAERACLLETIAVMDTMRIAPVDLIGFPIRLLVRAARTLPASLLRAVLANRVARGRGDKLPSLLLDLRAGKHRTEVGALNGAVALNAVRSGCQASVNTKVTAVVDGIASGLIPWNEYRGKPEKLLR